KAMQDSDRLFQFADLHNHGTRGIHAFLTNPWGLRSVGLLVVPCRAASARKRPPLGLPPPGGRRRAGRGHVNQRAIAEGVGAAVAVNQVCVLEYGFSSFGMNRSGKG